MQYIYFAPMIRVCKARPNKLGWELLIVQTLALVWPETLMHSLDSDSHWLLCALIECELVQFFSWELLMSGCWVWTWARITIEGEGTSHPFPPLIKLHTYTWIPPLSLPSPFYACHKDGDEENNYMSKVETFYLLFLPDMYQRVAESKLMKWWM